jgi:hypothetical protein
MLDAYYKNVQRTDQIMKVAPSEHKKRSTFHIVTWRPLQISAASRPRGWPPQRSLPMWTFGNDLLKRLLHEFFETDVK